MKFFSYESKFSQLLLNLCNACMLNVLWFLCSLPIVPALKKHLGNGAGERAANAATTLLLTALVALSVIFLIGQSYNPFIYFRF